MTLWKNSIKYLYFANLEQRITCFYVIKGTGIDDINNAFEGSLTFQPAVPSGEVDIVVSC
jgi:hypothetical protein